MSVQFHHVLELSLQGDMNIQIALRHADPLTQIALRDSVLFADI